MRKLLYLNTNYDDMIYKSKLLLSKYIAAKCRYNSHISYYNILYDTYGMCGFFPSCLPFSSIKIFQSQKNWVLITLDFISIISNIIIRFVLRNIIIWHIKNLNMTHPHILNQDNY